MPTSKYADLNNANSLTKMNYNFPFNIMHLNCCIIYNKMDKISLIISEIMIKILAVTETWLQQEVADLITVQAFNFKHKPRPNAIRGGGVGFLLTLH